MRQTLKNAKTIAVQNDGKILIGGGFSAYDGTAAGGIARLNANGTLDTAFQPGSGVNYAVEAIALQANGDILVGIRAMPPLELAGDTGSIGTMRPVFPCPDRFGQ